MRTVKCTQITRYEKQKIIVLDGDEENKKRVGKEKASMHVYLCTIGSHKGRSKYKFCIKQKWRRVVKEIASKTCDVEDTIFKNFKSVINTAILKLETSTQNITFANLISMFYFNFLLVL